MSHIRLERRGAVGRIILARPERRNVIDREMASELFSACSQFEQDGHVRVVHLSADGDDFCVGSDLLALSSALGATSEAHREDSEAFGRVLLGIRALMKPVVCSVQGRALGAGAGLATSCDLVLASDHRVGTAPGRADGVAHAHVALRRGQHRRADHRLVWGQARCASRAGGTADDRRAAG